MDIVFDIETIPRAIPESFLLKKKQKLEEEYAKPETVEKHLEDWKANKWCFQPGASQPICIGLYPDKGPLAVFANTDETRLAADLLEWFWELARVHGHTGHKLVGFNIKKFDLPQLMFSVAKLGKKLPVTFGKWDYIDLMKEPYGYDTGPYSLAYYAEMFGLEGKLMDGGQVTEVWDNGKGIDKIKAYCGQDVMITHALFEKFKLIHRF